MNNKFLTLYQAQSEIQQINNQKLQLDKSSQHRSYFLCFMLYFLQGNVISIGQTMPYLYKELPSYKTLALFSVIDLPFSFKFLLSPFLEKYTNLTYGKRKTWIIISQFFCSCILFISSFFTQVSLASIIAVLLMSSEFFLTIQDISLDSLSIKETRSPEKASIIQSIAQPFGYVIGSLLLLKLTSRQFATKIGLAEPITTPMMIIRVISSFLIITALIMHFMFRQTALQCQKKGKQKRLCEIVSYSKTFFHINSKYCRTALFFLLYYQGMKFYQAGYEYQLIKAGFSRDTLNTISNLISLPVLGLTLFTNSYIAKLGMKSTLITAISLLCVLYTFNILVFSLNPRLIIVTQFCALLLITFKNMVLYIMINSFPLHALSGMFITIMLSIWNLGELKTINTLIIDVFGWRGCALFGVLLQIIIILMIPSFFQWIQEGKVEIDSSIAEEQQMLNQFPQRLMPFAELADTLDGSINADEVE